MVNHFLSQGFESQEGFYECLVCKEPISNPICSTCIYGQIKAWLSNYPDLKQRIMPGLKNYLNIEGDMKEESMECACCGKKRLVVCPYCFTEYVLMSLKKLDTDKQVLREFIRFFNFDLDGKGYTSDIKELGV